MPAAVALGGNAGLGGDVGVPGGELPPLPALAASGAPRPPAPCPGRAASEAASATPRGGGRRGCSAGVPDGCASGCSDLDGRHDAASGDEPGVDAGVGRGEGIGEGAGVPSGVPDGVPSGEPDGVPSGVRHEVDELADQASEPLRDERADALCEKNSDEPRVGPAAADQGASGTPERGLQKLPTVTPVVIWNANAGSLATCSSLTGLPRRGRSSPGGVASTRPSSAATSSASSLAVSGPPGLPPLTGLPAPCILAAETSAARRTASLLCLL
jgi:hypothetical protein